jgi:hypothetical protein
MYIPGGTCGSWARLVRKHLEAAVGILPSVASSAAGSGTGERLAKGGECC